jgi:uncharacterized protein (TIGR03067 family)
VNASFLLVLAVAVVAPGPKGKVKDESVVGEWVAERTTFAGNRVPLPKEPVRYVFSVDGTWATYRGEKKHPGEHQVYDTDPSKAPPAIDLSFDEVDGDREPPNRPQVLRGIYKVDGDTLTLCLATNGGDRPKALESTAEVPARLWVFKRAKKKE